MGTKTGSLIVVALVKPALVVMVLGLLLALGVAGRDSRSLAQEGAATPATPVAIDFDQIVAERPAEIVSGACDDPGEPVAALSPLSTSEGEAQGQGTAIEAARSYTSIPIAIDAIFAGQTSVSVALSGDEPGKVIACGEIGGVPSEELSLIHI